MCFRQEFALWPSQLVRNLGDCNRIGLRRNFPLLVLTITFLVSSSNYILDMVPFD
jgi:hypothetical protein